MKRAQNPTSTKVGATRPPKKSPPVQDGSHPVNGSEASASENANDSEELTPPAQDDLDEQERRRFVDSQRRRVRDEFGKRINERIQEFDLLQSHAESPNGPFAVPIAKCWLLFDSECFYDCVVQLNSLLPTIVSHVYMSELASGSSEYPGFEKAIVALNSGKLINDRLKDGLAEMWIDSRQFQFVQPSTDSALSTLKQTAQGLLNILDRIEQEFADLIGWDGLDPPENL